MMMKIFVAVCFVVLTAPAWAQTIEPALQDAMDARNAARVAGDAETWGTYTTEDFVVISGDGGVTSKTERMAEITAGQGTEARAPADRSTRLYGNDTVIVVDRNAQLGVVSNVWVKVDGQWLVAHVQFTLFD